MNDQPQMDRLVTEWLRADAPPRAPQGVLAVALERVGEVGQEQPLGGRRFDAWIRRSPRSHWAIVGAMLAAVLLGTLAAAGALLRQEPVTPFGKVNGWIAYTAHSPLEDPDARSQPMDLYFVREGTDPRKIDGTEGEGPLRRVVCPSFSPDGKRLAYAEGAETTGIVNNTNVWSRRAVVIQGLDSTGLPTGAATRIDVPASGGDPCPEWSHDSRSIAFVAGDLMIASRSSDVAQPGTYTSDVRVPLRGSQVSDIAWSPGGEVVAIAGVTGTWLIPVDGSSPRQLATGGGSRLSWSPDGSQIAFETDDVEPLVRLVEVAGGRTRDLGAGFDPVWSPDGSRIAYEDATGIVIVDPDGSNAHVITPALLGPDAATQATARGLTWSPDGRRLLYVGVGGNTVGTRLISVSATDDPDPVVLATGTPDISGLGLSWQSALP